MSPLGIERQNSTETALIQGSLDRKPAKHTDRYIRSDSPVSETFDDYPRCIDMDIHRDIVSEIHLARPSLDIVDSCSFQAGPGMEHGGASEQVNMIVNEHEQDNFQHGLNEDANTEGAPNVLTNTPNSPNSMLKEQKRFSWMSGVKNPFSGPPRPYNRKNRIVTDKLDDHPNGYPRLASYINSDPNFAMYRRFGYLHNRVLLYRQDELCVMQESLEALDEEDEEKDPRLLTSRERDELNSPARRDLISEIDAKLKDYDNLLFREARLRSLDPPTDRNHDSLWNWLDNNKAVIKTEKSFVYYKDDFVGVGGGKENAPADEALERILDMLNWKILIYTFSTAEQREISGNQHDHYYLKTRIQLVTRAAGTICVLALVIIPVYFLFETNSTTLTKLGIVMGCTLIFPFIIDTFSRIDRQQVFAITVAYCAVLVVFLGNLQSMNCNPGSSSTRT